MSSTVLCEHPMLNIVQQRAYHTVYIKHGAYFMFQIISKDQYFAALNDETTHRRLEATNRKAIDLKHIQDAWVLHRLKNAKGLRILEIGGGYLRALGTIAGENEIWNLDEFKDDGTPTSGRRVPKPEGWRLVRSKLGEYSKELPKDYFDIVVSISVIEHVPPDAHPDFWKDHARVMKPGAVAYHAVDFYIGDEPEKHVEDKLDLLLTSIEGCGLYFGEKPVVDRPLRFSCSYASNPDYAMWVWNQMSTMPSLVRRRSRDQSVSLAVELKK